MNAMVFLISTIFNLYLMVVLLRFWLQLSKADFYNPLSQFVVKATHPVIGPMRRIIPSVGSIDVATLILALLVAMGKYLALSLLLGGNINPLGMIIIGALSVLKEFLTLVFWVLIMRAILSWVSQGGSPFEYVLHQLTEPLLSPIRRVLPPMGGMDLSVLVAIIGLKFVEMLLADFLPFY
ncbi:YggT family protein [Aestuariibacter sp. GS-14]|uniref:YggT family protein n=1 Tax=Aestuariibacter sp. GS-14 TaxID=2590670 RepID=UPI00112B2C52|nr:YggT family protein [Aestuariibacter sp. GS-14]TPV56791.1 YggT family protein [Aestuariibacter sp. GS-14]